MSFMIAYAAFKDFFVRVNFMKHDRLMGRDSGEAQCRNEYTSYSSLFGLITYHFYVGANDVTFRGMEIVRGSCHHTLLMFFMPTVQL